MLKNTRWFHSRRILERLDTPVMGLMTTLQWILDIKILEFHVAYFAINPFSLPNSELHKLFVRDIVNPLQVFFVWILLLRIWCSKSLLIVLFLPHQDLCGTQIASAWRLTLQNSLASDLLLNLLALLKFITLLFSLAQVLILLKIHNFLTELLSI